MRGPIPSQGKFAKQRRDWADMVAAKSVAVCYFRLTDVHGEVVKPALA